jgi:hypothetical protein
MELYDVQPNQNMAIAMAQAEMTHNSSRFSGLGGIGATLAA